MTSRRDVILAVALGSRRRSKDERRVLPDRRGRIDRRNAEFRVSHERRSGSDRRQVVRRKVDRDEGATLMEKARRKLTSRPEGWAKRS